MSVSNYARVGMADSLRLASVEVDETSVVDLCGKTLVVKRAVLGGDRLPPGRYSATDDSVSGFLSDSDGELVVTGGGYAVIVR